MSIANQLEARSLSIVNELEAGSLSIVNELETEDNTVVQPTPESEYEEMEWKVGDFLVVKFNLDNGKGFKKYIGKILKIDPDPKLYQIECFRPKRTRFEILVM